jgi:hypothetical protein
MMLGMRLATWIVLLLLTKRQLSAAALEDIAGNRSRLRRLDPRLLQQLLVLGFALVEAYRSLL